MPDEKLTRLQEYKKNLGSTRPWDLVNPNTKWVSDKDAESRLLTCRQCPEYIKITTQCKKCGCVMKAKARMADAECPIQKWGQIDA